MRKLARADALARKTGLGFFLWNLNWSKGFKFKLGRDWMDNLNFKLYGKGKILKAWTLALDRGGQ